MSKEKQIEEMAREMCHLSAECKTCQICNERYHGDDDDLCYFKCVAKEIINHGYRKQEWISVDERLPEESGIYLAYSYQGNRLVLDYSARHKLFNSFDSYSTEQAEVFAIGVTHWMPLPEAPKGGEE